MRLSEIPKEILFEQWNDQTYYNGMPIQNPVRDKCRAKSKDEASYRQCINLAKIEANKMAAASNLALMATGNTPSY